MMMWERLIDGYGGNVTKHIIETSWRMLLSGTLIIRSPMAATTEEWTGPVRVFCALTAREWLQIQESNWRILLAAGWEADRERYFMGTVGTVVKGELVSKAIDLRMV